MEKRIKIKKVLSAILILCGVALCMFPLVSNLIERRCQSEAVATYTEKVEAFSKEKMQEYIEEAEYYNGILYQTGGIQLNESDDDILSQKSYTRLLNASDTGVMGSIDIPEINVNLPIYHGISDEVLSRGAGHLEGSSLPVGGCNTRVILTGHRGLPGAKLFTRLDEMEKGDLFFIHVMGKILAYQVSEIEVIQPDETDSLTIVSGKDMVSLITCTPYGINTKRLVVTGERIAYVPEEHDGIERKRMSLREVIFAVIPFGLLMIITLYRKNKNRTEV